MENGYVDSIIFWFFFLNLLHYDYESFRFLTVTCSSFRMSPWVDSARQISPCTRTSPLGLRSVKAVPCLPIIVSAPVSFLCRLRGRMIHRMYTPADAKALVTRVRGWRRRLWVRVSIGG